jgi:4-amino-4-deoxy-L-arabinose transferase-like glycosyltransferase
MTAEERREWPDRRAAAAIAALLLLFQLVLQLHLSRVDSQTSDEGVHLSAGYSYWEWHDLSLNPEHPPLVKLLAGFAAHRVRPIFPPIEHRERLPEFFYDSWRENRALGEKFLYDAGNDADRLLFAGRVAAVGLTLLLGLAVFAMACVFFGPAGGVLATAMYVLDPTVAAHGHLITTDVAVSLGGVAVFAAGWRFARRRDAASTIVLGTALGFALLTKFTAVIFPASLAVVLLLLWGAREAVRRIPQLLVSVLVAWFVVVAGYGFSLTPPPATPSVSTTVSPDSHPAARLVAIVDPAYNVLRYLGRPRLYFKGLALVLGHVAGGHASFLLGRISESGWWYYFPVVAAVKIPVPVLVLLAVSLAVTLPRLREPAQWYWLAAAALYLLCAMTSRSDLGFRHLMPATVFLAIWIGSLGPELRGRRGLTFVTAALLVWLVVDFGRSYDMYLSYFNQFVGDRGYLVATDSNLDWGQDLKRIRAYQDRHPEIGVPYVEYPADGPSSLDYYGIRHRAEAPITTTTGVLIIGATRLTDPQYAFVRALPIADRITPGVFVYRLTGRGP